MVKVRFVNAGIVDVQLVSNSTDRVPLLDIREATSKENCRLSNGLRIKAYSFSRSLITLFVNLGNSYGTIVLVRPGGSTSGDVNEVQSKLRRRRGISCASVVVRNSRE